MRAMLEQNALYAAGLGSDLVNGFFSLLALLAALGAASWGVASLARLQAEETSGRT